MSGILPNLVILIEQIYDKYKDNKFILTKMINIIESLDKTLEEVNNNQMNKTNKMEEITKDQTDFIDKFFKHEKKIFYVTHNNQFFIYENNDFKLLNQNDLVIHIYTLINSTNNKDLIKAKFAIENKIMKEVKKNVLYKVIPTSKTIQNTLQLFTPIVFESKDIAKYFLTTLGDIILKKKNKYTFYLCEHMESLISWLSTSMSLYFGDSINFKYKINLKDECSNNRYFPVSNKHISIDVHNSIFNIYVLSCHYSNRFENSETFLLKKCKKKDKDKILKLTNFDIIVDNFIMKYLIIDNDNNNITSREMYFIWQYYIDEYMYPFIYNDRQLITVLQDKLQIVNNRFLNIKCDMIHEVNEFIKFIETNCETSFEIEEIFDIDEILTIYKDNINKELQLLDDDLSIRAISYFLPSYKVYDKYIGMKCKYWNKLEDVQEFIKDNNNGLYKDNYQMYDMYVEKGNKYTADKTYFELIYKKYD
tara:strand:+ start:3395 stop:4825 length:1431 start_codon:yes stop_codon:yes gene_type:complete